MTRVQVVRFPSNKNVDKPYKFMYNRRDEIKRGCFLMNIFRKLGLAAAVLTTVLVLSACMPGAGNSGEGGGTVMVDGQVVAGGGTGQAATGDTSQPAAAGANNAPAEDPGLLGSLGIFLPIILMFAVMYFLIIRPQRKQAKVTKTMQEGLKVGENVMTTSGFFGKIVGVGTDSFLVEFGEGRGFKVWVRKSDIAGIRTPVMTPPPASDDKKD